MTTQATNIQSRLPEGYKVVEEVNHNSSYYFYISTPKSTNTIKVRISDHDAICVNSRSHIQIIKSCGLITFNVDFFEDAVSELSEMLGIDISGYVYEVGRYGDVTLDFGKDWEVEEDVIAAWVAAKIETVNILILY